MVRWMGSLLAKVSIHAVLVGRLAWGPQPCRKQGQKLAQRWCSGCPMATERAVDVPCMLALLPILHQCICSSRVCQSLSFLTRSPIAHLGSRSTATEQGKVS